MPIRVNIDRAPPVTAPTRSGIRVNLDALDEPTTPETPSGGLSEFFTPSGMVGTAALIGGAALALKNPGTVGKLAKGLNTVRLQGMLSGLAVPKTILSNIGGAAIASAERRSMAPLKELLSSQTLRDVAREYKSGAARHIMSAGTASGKAIHGPGRLIGAIDTATQNAMQRAGITAEEAERLAFQTPLNKNFGKLGDTLESPAAHYLVPFRRTPFNVFREGFETMKPKNLQDPVQKLLLGGAVGAGAAHGAATADTSHPMSLGLGAAASNRYAVPYLLAAAGGRALAGGRDPESVAGEVLPVSEYGLASGITNPTQSLLNPAALRVLNRLLGSK